MEQIKSLRNSIQVILANNADEGSLSLEASLAIIGAFVVQYNKLDLSSWAELKSYIDQITSSFFKSKNKSRAKDSFQDCVIYLFKCLQPLQNGQKEKTLLSLKLKMIGSIENGYLSFNDKTFNAYASIKRVNDTPIDNYKVPNDAFSKAEEELEPNQKADEEESQGGNISDKRGGEGQNNNTPTPSRQNQNALNKPFADLYDKLKQTRQTEPSFTWQWQLDKSEYDSIKSCVNSNRIPTNSNITKKTAIILSLYIGEFYKREYEGGANPFSQLTEGINCRFDKFKHLCEILNKETYKSINQAHLWTLYVTGGLPIHYLNTKLEEEKRTQLIVGLAELLDPADDLDIEEGKTKLQKVTNTAIRESYQQGDGHSLYEYIKIIQNDRYPWADSDNDSVDFSNFKINVIEAARKRATERRKFELRYTLWTYMQESELKEATITPQMVFKPEDDGERHFAVSQNRLRSWGIDTNLSEFNLKIGDKSLDFHWCCNGDYVSNGLHDKIDLPILETDEIQEGNLLSGGVEIECVYNEGSKVLPRNYVYNPFKEGYIQFYTDDSPEMALWHSHKGNKSYRWSGILFEKRRYTTPSDIKTIDINESFAIAVFKECIHMEDRNTNKTLTIYNSHGQIYGKVKTDNTAHPITMANSIVPTCIQDNMVKCFMNGEESQAYIVSCPIEFEIYKAANDMFLAGKPYVKYKKAEEYNDYKIAWKDYDDNSRTLEQGLYVFRLSYGKSATELKCYVLPNDANISLYGDSEPYRITFGNIKDITSEDELAKQGISFNPGPKGKESYSFKIGNDNGYIVIETFHPRPKTHMYLHGKEIESSIIAYAEDIRIINDKRNSYKLSDRESLYKRLFEVISATITGENVPMTKTIEMRTVDGDITGNTPTIQAYTHTMSDGNNKGENLEFYFIDFSTYETQKLNSCDPIKEAKEIAKKQKHDGLLFQSLKGNRSGTILCAPDYISSDGTKLYLKEKADERKSRLASFANNKQYLKEEAYKQFELCCEHGIYFPIFDSLLCIIWDDQKEIYRDKRNFKDRMVEFLKGYLEYTNNKPDIKGLIRFSRELRFKWKSISGEITKLGAANGELQLLIK